MAARAQPQQHITVTVTRGNVTSAPVTVGGTGPQSGATTMPAAQSGMPAAQSGAPPVLYPYSSDVDGSSGKDEETGFAKDAEAGGYAAATSGESKPVKEGLSRMKWAIILGVVLACVIGGAVVAVVMICCFCNCCKVDWWWNDNIVVWHDNQQYQINLADCLNDHDDPVNSGRAHPVWDTCVEANKALGQGDDEAKYNCAMKICPGNVSPW